MVVLCSYLLRSSPAAKPQPVLLIFFVQPAALRRFVQGDPVAFGVFEVGDETVIADAHPRHKRLSAGVVDGFQRGVNLVDVDVDERPVVRWFVTVSFDECTG